MGTLRSRKVALSGCNHKFNNRILEAKRWPNEAEVNKFGVKKKEEKYDVMGSEKTNALIDYGIKKLAFKS